MANETQTTASTATSNEPASATSTTAATAAPVDGNKAVTGEVTTATTTTGTEPAATKTLGADAVKEGDAQTTEGKTEGDTKTDAQAAPGEYAEFKVPEGVSIDQELGTEFKGLAKDLKLPQAEAQKLVDLGTKLNAKFNEALTKQVLEQQTKWTEELKSDKELGGTQLPEKLATAQAGLRAFDPSGKLDKLLTETGLSNNVDVIRAFYNAGLTVKNDTIITGDAGASAAQSAGPGSLQRAGSILYGNSTKK